MTKAELVNAIAGGSGISKAAALKALESYIGAVAKELKKSGRLGLVGFGTFSVVKRKAREGRNPQTGKTIKIPAKKVVKFKAGKALADKVK
ncbi:MAG: HU family DNA-binding protein [Syntrophales bacterium]|nr:HU family DNA-binding protein [Syntrophales bacterium]